jgi:methylated-DNA-protein-cysteine methyltransferase-like protein
MPDGRDVPWQRVINARGTISLDARGPGGAIQRVLLEAEGVTFDEQGRVDLESHRWAGLDLAERNQILQPAGDA